MFTFIPFKIAGQSVSLISLWILKTISLYPPSSLMDILDPCTMYSTERTLTKCRMYAMAAVLFFIFSFQPKNLVLIIFTCSHGGEKT